MTTALDNCFLSSNQDTNLFFGVGGDRIPNFLFDEHETFFQLS